MYVRCFQAIITSLVAWNQTLPKVHLQSEHWPPAWPIRCIAMFLATTLNSTRQSRTWPQCHQNVWGIVHNFQLEIDLTVTSIGHHRKSSVPLFRGIFLVYLVDTFTKWLLEFLFWCFSKNVCNLVDIFHDRFRCCLQRYNITYLSIGMSVVLIVLIGKLINRNSKREKLALRETWNEVEYSI